MFTQTGTCKDCGESIALVFDKALGGGGTALVWTSSFGDWICEPTGDEHVPEGPDSVYQRDLDADTAGLSADDMRDDDSFNSVVDHMEGLGHSRTRVERDLREWIEEEGTEPLVPMDPLEALTYAILSINTDLYPDATSGNDMLYLEVNAERALAALARIRDYVIAAGEDLPDYVFGKDEEVPCSATETENLYPDVDDEYHPGSGEDDYDEAVQQERERG
jgi:hypothetical protein